MKFLAQIFGLGLGLLGGFQLSTRAASHHRPYPMPHQFAMLLEHPLRLSYRPAQKVLEDLALEPGMTVLDLGCGTGTYLCEVAQAVGESGLVHGVDLQQPLLYQARTRVTEAGFVDRVHLHCCGAYAMPMTDESVDIAFLIATFSQIPDKLAALAELHRVLRPKASLVISEELLDPAYLPASIVHHWLADTGFHYVAQSGSPFCYSTRYVKG